MDNHSPKRWYEQETWVKIASFLLIIFLLLLINWLLPDFFPTIFRLSTGGNVGEIVDFLRSFGVWAMLISFVLDVLVNAVGVLPSIFISTGNGILFGLPLGILISWSAESVGVILSFLFMRYFFRESAEKLIARSKSLEKIDELSGEKGWQVMALLRTIPYFPSGILTAFGAVSKMSLRDYALASFIGKFPSTALEVVVGHDVVNFHQHMDRLAIIATLLIIIYLYFFLRKRRNKGDGENK